MSNGIRAIRLGLTCALGAAPWLGAQTTAEYARRVDSLGKIWRSLSATVAARDTARGRLVPADSFRAGAIIVRADTPWTQLGHATAEQLAPIVARVYGRSADRLLAHQFVVRAAAGPNADVSVLSGVVDSTGTITLRGSDYAQTKPLLNSWKQKTEHTMMGELDATIRDWLLTVVPLDPPTASTWSDARISLILAPSVASRECVYGNIKRCTQVLGLIPIEDPAFAFLDSMGRRDLVRTWGPLVRAAAPAQFDRCVTRNVQPACDSLAHSIPTDVIRSPVSPSVRQSFLRFALLRGGDGAFDRFVKPGTIRQRIEAASGMSADSVAARWHDTIMDARSSSPAVDAETAISAILWATLCGALALRSSRWR